MIDDLSLIAIGRQFLEFTIQKEQLFRALQEAQTKVKELEAQIATSAKE